MAVVSCGNMFVGSQRQMHDESDADSHYIVAPYVSFCSWRNSMHDFFFGIASFWCEVCHISFRSQSVIGMSGTMLRKHTVNVSLVMVSKRQLHRAVNSCQ